MSFTDRREAGERLAAGLAAHHGEAGVVFGLARGGAVVAGPVATALEMPLDIILVRKIGVPAQPELAMGAIADGGALATVRNEEVIRLCGIGKAEFESARAQEAKTIERRKASYFAGRTRPDVSDGLAIVVDDGIATGATMRAALRAVRALGPKRIILAVPVAPRGTLTALRGEADEIMCLETHDPFGAVGLYYADFRQVSDAEVMEALDRSGPPDDRSTSERA